MSHILTQRATSIHRVQVLGFSDSIIKQLHECTEAIARAARQPNSTARRSFYLPSCHRVRTSYCRGTPPSRRAHEHTPRPNRKLDTSGSGFRRAYTCSHSKPPLCMPVLECRMSRGHILASSPHGATGPVIRVWRLVSAVGWSSASSAACAAPVTTVRLLHAPIQRAPQGPGAV